MDEHAFAGINARLPPLFRLQLQGLAAASALRDRMLDQSEGIQAASSPSALSLCRGLCQHSCVCVCVLYMHLLICVSKGMFGILWALVCYCCFFFSDIYVFNLQYGKKFCATFAYPHLRSSIFKELYRLILFCFKCCLWRHEIVFLELAERVA